MNYKIINQYKINISNNNHYIKLLQKLLKHSIKLNNENNFKVICYEIYKIRKRKSHIHRLLKQYKDKNINNPRLKLFINYPILCLPFKRKYDYPKEIKETLSIIYKIDLPEELINIICDYYICNEYT